MEHVRKGLRLVFIVAATLACTTLVSAAEPLGTGNPQATASSRQSLESWTHAAVARQYDAMEHSAPFDQVSTEINRLFVQAMAYTPASEAAAFREAACARRMVWLLQGERDAKERVELLKFLRVNDTFARTLLFLVRPETETSGQVVKILQRLRKERGDKVETYSQLAAAICVVHGRPVTLRINENEVTAGDPLAIFDYFVANESRMLCGIRTVAADLLVYVVDSTASVDEMTWALEHYAGNQTIGQAFFDIKYDYRFARAGADKEVTRQGFTLPNIYKYGGICADQAYFATMVAKSIGVPSCYAAGRSAEAGHAWVGFLQFDDRHCWWNFDMGRYAAYWNLRGIVRDPITGQMVPDSYIALTAELIGSNPVNRQSAVALADAVNFGIVLDSRGLLIVAPPPDANVTGVMAKPRTDPSAAAIELAEAAVKLAPADRNCWIPLAVLAQRGKLSTEQEQTWVQLLFQLCGNKYPDFAFTILAPMIDSVANPTDRDRMWGEAIDTFRNRDDLVAACLMQQAAIWDEQKQLDRAGALYWQVVQRSAQSSPYILPALEKCEQVLVRTGRSTEIVSLYADAWGRTRRPDPGPPVSQSNWYLVGQKLQQKLEANGDKQKAQSVKAELEQALRPRNAIEIMK